MLRLMGSLSQLTEEVITCRRCDEAWGFSSRTPNSGYFKFPPLIGKTKNARLLFVGINPRISESNRWLHEHVMQAKENFIGLARNVVRDRAYIASDGQEPHYRLHVRFVREIFGSSFSFEQVAAVTEIFFCATKNSQNLPNPGSPCADLYFAETVRLANPLVIVAVGGRVMSYFRTRPHEYEGGQQLVLKFKDRKVPVVKIPHPADPNLSESEKNKRISNTAAATRALLGDNFRRD